MFASSQLQIFDVARATGWTVNEQNHLINLTVKAYALPHFTKSICARASYLLPTILLVSHFNLRICVK